MARAKPAPAHSINNVVAFDERRQRIGSGLAIGATAMTVDLMGKLHQLRRRNRDSLLTLLTAVLLLMIFVFAPLQAAGIFLFQTFAIAGLLAMIGGALIISGNPIALGLLSIAFIANLVVFFLRLSCPHPYDLPLLAGAWVALPVHLRILDARDPVGWLDCTRR